MTTTAEPTSTEPGVTTTTEPAAANVPAWTAQLDKDLQANERLTSFKTIGEMGKALLDLEGKSKDAITVPGENATDEERAAFYGKLGRPEAAEKYAFTNPVELPEGYTPEVEAVMKGIFFKANMTATQAEMVNAEYVALLKQGQEMQQQQQKEATDKAINTLKDEWKGDAFKENSALAVRAFAKFGGDEAKTFIEETKINGLPLGDHPVFLKIFAGIGKAISDDSSYSGRGGTAGEKSDEEKAKARFPATYK